MRSAAAAAILRLALVLSACGGGSSKPPKPSKDVSIEVENFGQGIQVSAPQRVEAGVRKVFFTNSANDGEHSAQLVRWDGERAPAAVLRAANAWGEKGKPLPPWIHLAGGFGPAKPSARREATLRLEPGRYLAVDLEAKGKPAYSQFSVVGEPGKDPLPATQASIRAADYSFKATNLKAGSTDVLFANAGKQPHHLVAAPLAKGATLADVRRFARTEKGRPPIDEKKALSTAVLDGKKSATVKLDLQRGKYVLLCFIPDRKGGPPHVAKGMVAVTQVR